MVGFARGLALLLLVAALMLRAAWGDPAETEVDLALVLAVDVSFSMEKDEQELQRQGFIEAFRSPEVHDAIRKGMLGRIAVTYIEWAGVTHQEVIVPWTVIEGSADSMEFAGQLAWRPPGSRGYTSISSAIDFSLWKLQTSGVRATRQVIDVSGDGVNNPGRPVAAARDRAVAQGVTINGLPIMLRRTDGFWDVPALDLYYRDCVVGGSGAFMIPVRNKAQFTEAIRTKIVREITERLRPHVLPAQAEAPAKCMVGENNG
jgi:hypothetical protein